jgi:hypothetical protein
MRDHDMTFSLVASSGKSASIPPKFVVVTKRHRFIRSLLYAITGDVNEIFDHISLEAEWLASSAETFEEVNASMAKTFSPPINTQAGDSFKLEVKLQMPLKTEELPPRSKPFTTLFKRKVEV